LLDAEGRVLAGEEVRRRNAAVATVALIRREDSAFDADFLDEFLAGRIVTPTRNPGPHGRSGVRPLSGSKARQRRHLFFSIGERPHLALLHDLQLGRRHGLRQGRRVLANPFANSRFAETDQPCHHAAAGIAHGVGQHRPAAATRAFIAAGLLRLACR